jgi:hypothetical protein
MKSDTHFFMIWTHRNGEGLFGAASKPVVRNGSLLCFPNEASARAECDRLNASGIGVAHYSVRPTRLQALKQIAERFSVLPRVATSACTTSLKMACEGKNGSAYRCLSNPNCIEPPHRPMGFSDFRILSRAETVRTSLA